MSNCTETDQNHINYNSLADIGNKSYQKHHDHQKGNTLQLEGATSFNNTVGEWRVSTNFDGCSSESTITYVDEEYVEVATLIDTQNEKESHTKEEDKRVYEIITPLDYEKVRLTPKVDQGNEEISFSDHEIFDVDMYRTTQSPSTNEDPEVQMELKELYDEIADNNNLSSLLHDLSNNEDEYIEPQVAIRE